MVSVVLEGYVRISDGLLNAILIGDFSALQLRIILALLRMSYQVRGPVTLSLEAIMRSWVSPGGLVTVSQEGLAEALGSRVSGGFRLAFSELVARDVVRIIKPARGRTAATYLPSGTRRNGVRALGRRR